MRGHDDRGSHCGLDQGSAGACFRCKAGRRRNAEAAAQLAVAADRVATIERVHRRLHYIDGVRASRSSNTSRIFAAISPPCCPRRSARRRPSSSREWTSSCRPPPRIPLSFIVNELITNAAKHGEGRIAVRLEPNPGQGYALSVSNDGPALAEEFDPAACKGLGMKIIRSFVERIGGELRIGRGDRTKVRGSWCCSRDTAPAPSRIAAVRSTARAARNTQ